MGLLTPDKSESGQSLTYLGLNRLVLFPVGSVLAEMLSGQEALSWSLPASLDTIFPVACESSSNPTQDCFVRNNEAKIAPKILMIEACDKILPIVI